jgi:hypothetical protein
MTKWYDEHYTNPYPTYRDCEMLAEAGMVSINQVKQWFVNIRRRTQNEFRRKRTARTGKLRNENESSSKSSSDDSGILNEINILSAQLHALENDNQLVKVDSPSAPTNLSTQPTQAFSVNYYNQYYSSMYSSPGYNKPNAFTSTPNVYNTSADSTSLSSGSMPNYRYDYSNFYNSFSQSYNSFY